MVLIVLEEVVIGGILAGVGIVVYKSIKELRKIRNRESEILKEKEQEKQKAADEFSKIVKAYDDRLDKAVIADMYNDIRKYKWAVSEETSKEFMRRIESKLGQIIAEEVAESTETRLDKRLPIEHISPTYQKTFYRVVQESSA